MLPFAFICFNLANCSAGSALELYFTLCLRKYTCVKKGIICF